MVGNTLLSSVAVQVILTGESMQVGEEEQGVVGLLKVISSKTFRHLSISRLRAARVDSLVSAFI